MATMDVCGCPCRDTSARRGRNNKIKAQRRKGGGGESDGEARVYLAAIIMARRERIDPPTGGSIAGATFVDCP